MALQSIRVTCLRSISITILYWFFFSYFFCAQLVWLTAWPLAELHCVFVFHLRRYHHLPLRLLKCCFTGDKWVCSDFNNMRSLWLQLELRVHAITTAMALALALELISQNTLPHMRSQLANLSHESRPRRDEARQFALVSVSVSVSIRFCFRFQFQFGFSFGLFRARARHSNARWQHY